MSVISPTSKLIDESGGSMVFAVPIANSDEIGKLFSLIEEADPSQINDGEGPSFSNIANLDLRALRVLLKDIGISHTTLEEVFMKVTGKKVSKYVAQGINAPEKDNKVHQYSQ